MYNYMKMRLPAISINESYARSVVAAFTCPLSPTVEEVNDIKTAVSEAVTNCVVHAYNQSTEPSEREILLEVETNDDLLTVSVTDFGVGIADVQRAKTPFYTTKPNDERSGMGFSVMESFMDSLSVVSAVGSGTTVRMSKRIGAQNA